MEKNSENNVLRNLLEEKLYPMKINVNKGFECLVYLGTVYYNYNTNSNLSNYSPKEPPRKKEKRNGIIWRKKNGQCNAHSEQKII